MHCSTGVTCSNDKVLLEVGFSSECRAKCSGNVHFSALLVQFGFYFSWCEGLKSEGNSYSSAACEKVLLVVHFSSQLVMRLRILFLIFVDLAACVFGQSSWIAGLGLGQVKKVKKLVFLGQQS